MEWLAFKQNFFSAIVRNEGNFLPGASLKTVVRRKINGNDGLRGCLAFKVQRVGTVAASTEFYLGPNEQNALESLGREEGTALSTTAGGSSDVITAMSSYRRTI